MYLRFKPLCAALLAAGLVPSAAWALNAPTAADSYINSAPAAAAINYGNATSLKAVGSTAKSLLRFDLSALPAGTVGADVSKATLYLWIGTVNTPGALQVSDVSSAWSELAVSNNTAPSLGAIVATNVATPASTVGYYVAVDVTNSVKSWINSGTNYGLAVEADAGSPTTSVLLDSKESGGTSHPAYIEIATGKGISSVGVTAPVTNSGTATAPVIGMTAANGSSNGYLSSADWNTFNNKGNGSISLVSASSPLSVLNGTTLPAISIAQAGAFTDGYLSALDWNTFNSKGNGSVTSFSAGSLPLAVANPSTTPTLSMNGTWSDAQVADNLTLNGGTVNNTAIGGTTPAAGSFTGLNANTLALGAASPVASAILDLTSSSQGLLPPRMTTAQRTAIAAPATGLVVYDTDLQALELYNGTAWTSLGSGSGTVTQVSASAPLSVANGNSTPAISLSQAGASSNGYLSSTDWNTFNNKGDGDITGVTAGIGLGGGGASGAVTLNLANTAVTPGSYTSANITVDAQGRITAAANGSGGGVSSVGVTAPVVNTGTASAPVIGMGQASGSASGYLSSADWTTFNGKVGTVTAGTGLSGGGSGASVTLSLANTPSTASAPNTLVLRDPSGNFSAGTITASLNGNASTATTATSATTATTAGSAATATALAANGTNCLAGQFPLGVDAQGNAENCTAAGTGTITGVTAGTGMTGGGASGNVTLNIATGGVTTTQILDGTVASADIANGTITGSDIANNTVASGNMTNSGVAAGSYTNANITVDSAGRVTAAANGSAGGSAPTVVLDGAVPTSVGITTGGFIATGGVSINGEPGNHHLVGTTCSNVTLLATLSQMPSVSEVYTLQVRQGTSGNPYTYANLGSACTLGTGNPQSCTINASTSLTAFSTLGVSLSTGGVAFNAGGAALSVRLLCN